MAFGDVLIIVSRICKGRYASAEAVQQLTEAIKRLQLRSDLVWNRGDNWWRVRATDAGRLPVGGRPVHHDDAHLHQWRLTCHLPTALPKAPETATLLDRKKSTHVLLWPGPCT